MPPLEFAFRASTKRSKTKNRYLYPFYHTTTTYTPSILHLTQTRYNSLTINTLISVGYYEFHLHTSYTHHMLPCGTSTGGRHYGIGKQKSLSLRQIVLRPYAVLSTAYVQTDCEAARWGV